jgi:hypothetical protein
VGLSVFLSIPVFVPRRSLFQRLIAGIHARASDIAALESQGLIAPDADAAMYTPTRETVPTLRCRIDGQRCHHRKTTVIPWCSPCQPESALQFKLAGSGKKQIRWEPLNRFQKRARLSLRMQRER